MLAMIASRTEALSSMTCILLVILTLDPFLYFAISVRMLIELGNLHPFVSRISQLNEEAMIQPEDEWEKPNDKQLKQTDWPNNGDVNFYNVTLKQNMDFQEFDVDQVSLTIKAGTKIGIVSENMNCSKGIFNALLRIYDVIEGSIQIKRVDIAKVGLQTLRTKALYVSSDPLILPGSIWNFIDPMGTFNAQQVRVALQSVNLFEHVRNATPDGLESNL